MIDKKFNKLGIDVNVSKLIRGIYKKAIPNTKLNGENAKTLPVRLGTKKDFYFYHFYSILY